MAEPKLIPERRGRVFPVTVIVMSTDGKVEMARSVRNIRIVQRGARFLAWRMGAWTPVVRNADGSFTLTAVVGDTTPNWRN